LLLTVSVSFVKEIIRRKALDDKKVNKVKKIHLYSPTANGYVIMMFCLFVLRYHYGEDVGIVHQGVEKDDENYLVAIDLSLVSGFTIMYNWSIETDGSYVMKEAKIEEENDKESVDMEQVKKHFDMCAVVYCSCKNCVSRPCDRCEGFIHSLNH
jgi:hypothetical protein